MFSRTVAMLVSVSLVFAVVVAPGHAGNSCSWEHPCDSGQDCNNNCSVSVSQGTETINPKTGQCVLPITITVRCPGNPATSCESTVTVPCTSIEGISIECDECTFTVTPAPGGGGTNCGSANWGNLGTPGSRCGCFDVECTDTP